MIDIEKAKKEFIKYTENYDLGNERIKAKQIHSLRVMEVSKQIAEGLNLKQEEIKLAMIIGLLHDIARFEQFTQYGTYKDMESFDHGDFAVGILQKDLRKYVEIDEYDEIIFKAVKNHNKFQIEEGLTEKEELFSKIIRDADKIDIFYQGVVRYWKGNEQEVEDSKISEDIVKSIKNNLLTKTKSKMDEKPLDSVMRVIAFIFDVNFKSSFQIIEGEDYINKILDRYKIKDEDTKQKVEEIRKIANEYVHEHVK